MILPRLSATVLGAILGLSMHHPAAAQSLNDVTNLLQNRLLPQNGGQERRDDARDAYNQGRADAYREQQNGRGDDRRGDDRRGNDRRGDDRRRYEDDRRRGDNDRQRRYRDDQRHQEDMARARADEDRARRESGRY